MILSKIATLFAPNPDQLRARALYIAAHEQARNPFFYESALVPDTLDGRFDMIVLHVSMVNERLAAEGDHSEGVRRAIVDTLMEDMDQSLREQSVGDSGILHKVQRMGEAYFGREKAYIESFDDATVLAATLLRNLYNVNAEEATDAQRKGAGIIAEYCLDSRDHLRNISFDDLNANATLWASL